MNVPSHTDTFCLHVDYLRTLTDRLSIDLQSINLALTTYDHPAYATVALYMDGLGQLSQQLTGEVVRLQGFTHALGAESNGATAEVLEAV